MINKILAAASYTTQICQSSYTSPNKVPNNPHASFMMMGGMGAVRDLVGDEWLEGRIEVVWLAAAVISSIKSELLLFRVWSPTK